MSHSTPQLLLRILTGKHAGAEIALKVGDYSIGAEEDCDIVIFDCGLNSNALSIDAHLHVQLRLDTSDPNDGEVFSVNQPVRFGEVVIVFFDHANPLTRPADLFLLQTLLAPTNKSVVRKFGASRWVAGLSVCSILALCLITLQSPKSTAATFTAERRENTLMQVNKILADSRFSNVQASGYEKNIVVSGLVRNRDEKLRLAALLQAIQSNAIRHEYASEVEVTAAIIDVIGLPGIKISHSGRGNFVVLGDVPESIQKKPEIRRLKSDLKSVINEITFSEKPREIESDSLNQEPNIAGYQFRLAPDGSKYFISK